MTTEKTPAVKATDWTEDEIKVIAMYQEKLGMTRSNAIRKLRTDKRTPAQQLADGPVSRKAAQEPVKAEPKPKAATPKAKPAKGEHKATRQGRYNKEMVIKLYMEEGLNPTEIAERGKRDSSPAGIKGISPVYCHRILFGNENSGGISTEQAARRREQAARVKAWAAEKAKKG